MKHRRALTRAAVVSSAGAPERALESSASAPTGGKRARVLSHGQSAPRRVVEGRQGRSAAGDRCQRGRARRVSPQELGCQPPFVVPHSPTISTSASPTPIADPLGVRCQVWRLSSSARSSKAAMTRSPSRLYGDRAIEVECSTLRVATAREVRRRVRYRSTGSPQGGGAWVGRVRRCGTGDVEWTALLNRDARAIERPRRMGRHDQATHGATEPDEPSRIVTSPPWITPSRPWPDSSGTRYFSSHSGCTRAFLPGARRPPRAVPPRLPRTADSRVARGSGSAMCHRHVSRIARHLEPAARLRSNEQERIDGIPLAARGASPHDAQALGISQSRRD